MGKYQPLARYLTSRDDDTWNATFQEIEAQLGFELPRSAHQHRAWWANQRDGNHSQAAGWQSAGWETKEVDLRSGVVRFERRGRRPERQETAPPALGPQLADLWKRASELTGIEDRDALIEAALTALIRREAGKWLIAVGGTMPDAKAAPRERPFA